MWITFVNTSPLVEDSGRSALIRTTFVSHPSRAARTWYEKKAPHEGIRVHELHSWLLLARK